MIKTKPLLLLSAVFALFILIFSGCNLGASPDETQPTDPPDVSFTIAEPVELAGPQAGTQMYWADDSILVYVPGGSFIMGADGVDRLEHQVALSSYWIYQSEVTNRQYQMCVQAGICSPLSEPTSQAALTDPALVNNPVVSADWDQAAVYCNWVTGALPTEAQWELAARGPNSTPYPWGDSEPACDLLNFNNCLGKPTPVDNYPTGKSYYNVLDMAGNVYEWARDWYAPDYYRNSPSQDPLGPDSGDTRVIRSSSYMTGRNNVEVSNRYFLAPSRNRLDLGFRCVVEKPTQLSPACQTAGISATGCPAVPFTGGSNQSCSATPRVVRATNGCGENNTGFASFQVSGAFEIGPGGTAGCNLNESSVICSGNGGNATVSICNPSVLQAPPGGAVACPVGYVPNPSGGCIYGGSCPVGFVPGANGCVVPPPALVPVVTACEGTAVAVAGQGCVDPASCALPQIFLPDAGCVDTQLCFPPNVYLPAEGCVSPSTILSCAPPSIYDPFRGCIDPIADMIQNCPIGFYNAAGADPAVCLPPEPIGCAVYAVATGRNCLEDSFTRSQPSTPPTPLPNVNVGGSSLAPQELANYLSGIQDSPSFCPAGTYFDMGAGACVPPGGGNGSGQGQPAGQMGAPTSCLAGFTYNSAAMCCQGSAYSTCPSGQALVGGACAPVNSRCTDVSAPINSCSGDRPGNNPGGDNPGSEGNNPNPNPGGEVCPGGGVYTCDPVCGCAPP